MLAQPSAKGLTRRDDRIIIHFDYDCFYASVVEAENPSLKHLPLAIQQKQIIVTCNYEARRRGLYKLQLITEARATCPEVIIVLGEDLTRFRNASKDNYNFLRKFSWNDRVERLGFDEVWMDVTDMVEYNLALLNRNDLRHSFFQLDREDPLQGFEYDATRFAGHIWPKSGSRQVSDTDTLSLRLALGSHASMHFRKLLEHEKGYTSTVGISTSRLLSKLVGNENKPQGQTTLIPPYGSSPAPGSVNNAQSFMDSHDVGKVPWIGFKSAQKLREAVLQRPAEFYTGLVYGGSKESVTVKMARKLPDLGPEKLETLLGGAGQPKGIGARTWGLLHGADNSEVAQARNVPHQISIEDSYVRLDTMKQLTDEMISLSTRLIDRMRIDLTDPEEGLASRWIGKPHTLRLTTRPRLPVSADGTRPRTFKRISRSGMMPSFVFSLQDHPEALADRLVAENLMPLFKKLHPEKSGWNLSLVNVAATDMVDIGTSSKAAVGRNIQSMFQKQDDVLKDFRVASSGGAKRETSTIQEEPFPAEVPTYAYVNGDRDATPGDLDDSEEAPITLFDDDADEEEEEEHEGSIADDSAVSGYVSGSQGFECSICGEMIPEFARSAHERFHLDTG